MKNFKKNDGFTLVELIVVIAILAILGAVAVPAYSSYVERTNKQADLTLISEMEQALLLAYYADPNSFDGDAVVSLSVTGNAENYGSEFVNDAMNAAFGENWKTTLKLKYDGWESKNVELSTFKGKESYMLGKVDDLTQGLAKPIEAFLTEGGDGFKNFMAANGINAADKTTASNAAVLYVANNTANLNADQQDAVIKTITGANDSGGIANMLNNINNNAFGGNDLVSSAAAMYAVAEAYAQYSGQTIDLTFTDNETPESAASKISTAFNKLARGGGTDKMNKYLAEQAEKDVKAYLDIMSTVNSAKSQVIGNLDKLGVSDENGNTKYTWANTYDKMFENYTNGGVLVFLKLDENGAPVTDTTLAEE